MSFFRAKLRQYIDGQLDAIGQTPGMWGPPIGVELQFLQLIEFRSVIMRSDFKYPRSVLTAYHAFLVRKFPEAQPAPLADILEQAKRTDELVPILQEFRGEQVTETFSPLVRKFWLHRDWESWRIEPVESGPAQSVSIEFSEAPLCFDGQEMRILNMLLCCLNGNDPGDVELVDFRSKEVVWFGKLD